MSRLIIVALAFIVGTLAAGCSFHNSQKQFARQNSQPPPNMSDGELASYLDAKADAAIESILDRHDFEERRIAAETLIRLGECVLPKLRYAVAKEFSGKSARDYEWAWSPGRSLMEVLVALDEVGISPVEFRLSYYFYLLGQSRADMDRLEFLIVREGRKAQLALRGYVAEMDRTKSLGEKGDIPGECDGMVRAICILAYEYHDKWVFPYAGKVILNSSQRTLKHDCVMALYEFSGAEYISVVARAYLSEEPDPNGAGFPAINAARSQDWYLEDFKAFLYEQIWSKCGVRMRDDQIPSFPEAKNRDDVIKATARWLEENGPYIYVSHNPDDLRLPRNPDDLEISVIMKSSHSEKQKLNLILIDEDARNAQVPHNIWSRIPEQHRRNWPSLDKYEKDFLIQDAAKSWENDEREEDKAVAAAVPLETWLKIPLAKRTAWAALSEEEREALISSAREQKAEK